MHKNSYDLDRIHRAEYPTDPNQTKFSTEYDGEKLHRTLKTRHLSMIAIGGAIGTGLFVASGKSIAEGGPGGALVSYAIVGLMVFFLMTSLGEMAAFIPVSGSFNTYGSRFVDPAYGFALGWNYWFSWSITIATELAAGAGIIQYWTDSVPGIVWSIILLVFMIGFNVLSVKSYAGALGGKVYGVSNLSVGEAPFVNGFLGVLGVFLVAGFSFQGTELVGVTAGESANPEKDVPKAVKQVFWRILLFYICAIFVVSMLIPYTDPDLTRGGITTSPFTLAFQLSGFSAAPHAMNAVILVTVFSAGNSGMYGASRTLWMLANEGKAPRFLKRVDSRGIPIYALGFTALIACLSFFTSLFGNSVVFNWLFNAASITGLLSWLGIAISHYRFRKAYIAQGRDLKDLPYRAKLYPFGPIFAFILILIMIVGQGYGKFTTTPVDWVGLVATYIGVVIFLIFYVGYKVAKKSKLVPLMECDFSRSNR
ncbi:hypothetical protein K7432_002436 [Basidiobolus ranarum]|uniref:Amino acid permease/ SLC12A domain-containing protein n=1 Tax=Basidiobolus ranarum TaxID=34480 RepID=A0ABR2X1H7_9FUNG